MILNNYSKITIKASFFLSLIPLLSSNIMAQSIPLGMPFFDEAVRRSQLMGLVNENVSFMIRPVHPKMALGIENPNGNDSLLYPIPEGMVIILTVGLMAQ